MYTYMTVYSYRLSSITQERERERERDPISQSGFYACYCIILYMIVLRSRKQCDHTRIELYILDVCG